MAVIQKVLSSLGNILLLRPNARPLTFARSIAQALLGLRMTLPYFSSSDWYVGLHLCRTMLLMSQPVNRLHTNLEQRAHIKLDNEASKRRQAGPRARRSAADRE